MQCQKCGGQGTVVADNVPRKDGAKASFVWCPECGTLLQLIDYGHTVKSCLMVPGIAARKPER